MCDVNDNDMPKLIKRLNLTNEQCKKCQGENGKAVFLLRNDDKPMCKSCFLLFATHKFRSEFGKSQVVRQGERLLVGFSGGPSSMAMLTLVAQGLSENQFRKLRFTPVIVHIYESDTFSIDIENVLKNCGFPYYLISADDLIDGKYKLVNELLLQSRSPTAYKTAKLILLKHALTKLALKYECSRVMLANNCTRQSMRFLSNIAQGSGSAEDAAFHDIRQGISILQPMRQFSIKEITFINRFYNENCSISFVPNEETGADKTHSIDRLTEGFIASLTSDFPSTIFTISKTAEKMINIAANEEKKQCLFCGNVYRCNRDRLEEASAVNAMAFSHRLLMPNDQNQNEVPVTNGDRCPTNQQQLCYSCQSIQDEIGLSLI